MERRSFFTRLLAAIGFASTTGALTVTEVDAQAKTGPGPTEKQPLYLVDSAQVDLKVLAQNTVGRGIFIPYIPPIDSHFPAIMKVRETEREEVMQLSADGDRAAEAERLEVALAGVSTAAAGWNQNPANPGDWAWHPAYQDTLDLRRKFEASVKLISDTMPVTKMAMIYPCGCSATGHAPILDSAGLPQYCAEHGDHEHPNGHVIYGARVKITNVIW